MPVIMKARRTTVLKSRTAISFPVGRNKSSTRLSDLSAAAVGEICDALRPLLADVFALYLKTKNFHWHMHGSHFRDYHLLLDEQGEEIFAMTDAIAERGRKIGAHALRSIGEIARHQRLSDNDECAVGPQRHACRTLPR